MSSAMKFGCAEEECGSNTTVIDGVYFWETNELGIAKDGVRLTGFANLPPGASKLTVIEDRLVPVDPGGHPIPGEDATGVTLQFEINGEAYDVIIISVRRMVRHIASPGDPIETYRMVYQSKQYPPTTKDLCDTAEVAEGVAALDLIAFERDRYDPVTRDVIWGPATDGWFNLACLSGAPAKTFRLRAARAATLPGAALGHDQAQAAFSMWNADYCGDGVPYTVPGEPLRVKDAAGAISPFSGWSWSTPAQLGSYEAIWGPNGAVCLDTPRREENVPGDLATTVRAHCAEIGHPLPPCATNAKHFDWKKLGYYFTANPL